MPIYDFKCPKCGQNKSLYYDAWDAGFYVPVCRKCEVVMQKQIAIPTIIVKNPHPARKGRGKGK